MGGSLDSQQEPDETSLFLLMVPSETANSEQEPLSVGGRYGTTAPVPIPSAEILPDLEYAFDCRPYGPLGFNANDSAGMDGNRKSAISRLADSIPAIESNRSTLAAFKLKKLFITLQTWELPSLSRFKMA